MNSEAEFTCDEAIKVANAVLFQTYEKHLTDMEVNVLKGAWNNYSYEKIAEECGYSEPYIRGNIGKDLWDRLSKTLGEEVKKTNFKEPLKREWEKQSSSEDNRKPGLAYPEGSVPLDSPYYIERPGVESKCYDAILQPGSLIQIQAPKQMGKTSLLNRIIAHAESKGYRTARLNFLDADAANFGNLNNFLGWFSANITSLLELPDLIGDYWKLAAIIGSKLSCKSYFKRHLLQQIESPLVLALDEADRILQYPEISQDFFDMLRSWYEEANNKDIWKKLRLVVVHSTEDYGKLDINKSPFNVGLQIELNEFTSEQVQSLVKQHQLDLIEGENFTSLRELVGGHPYLVRLALYYLARQEVTLEKLLQDAPTDAGIYRHHLHRHWEIISKNTLLAEAFKQVINADKPVQLETTLAYKLYSMGLIKQQGNYCSSRCKLYRRYFLERLVNQA
ncbi:AAA-like domain-containing protein [Argonema galeatum]|uniref:AAA-like domain-containing protein n=1 Tax=Argonema galeatum TaxID=2942762 RepID=UPI00201270C2|nr:AAA-like domain-containing protein [Argonema galeatum]MCL1464800.1 AAA-like domain-containing protein [Argonema galeatum A003/A1]